MKRRAHVLHNLLSGCVQRKDYHVLAKHLPEKHEYIISVRLTSFQQELYKVNF
jgi:transcriptional regulator ATRX